MVNKKLIFGIILIVMLAMIFASFGVLASTGESDCSQKVCAANYKLINNAGNKVKSSDSMLYSECKKTETNRKFYYYSTPGEGGAGPSGWVELTVKPRDETSKKGCCCEKEELKCTQADCGGGQLITKTPAEDVEVEEGIKQLYQNGLVKDKECLSPNEFKFKTEYSKGNYGCCCKKTPTTDKCTQANDCPDGYTIYGEGQDKITLNACNTLVAHGGKANIDETLIKDYNTKYDWGIYLNKQVVDTSSNKSAVGCCCYKEKPAVTGADCGKICTKAGEKEKKNYTIFKDARTDAEYLNPVNNSEKECGYPPEDPFIIPGVPDSAGLYSKKPVKVSEDGSNLKLDNNGKLICCCMEPIKCEEKGGQCYDAKSCSELDATLDATKKNLDSDYTNTFNPILDKALEEMRFVPLPGTEGKSGAIIGCTDQQVCCTPKVKCKDLGGSIVAKDKCSADKIMPGTFIDVKEGQVCCNIIKRFPCSECFEPGKLFSWDCIFCMFSTLWGSRVAGIYAANVGTCYVEEPLVESMCESCNNYETNKFKDKTSCEQNKGIWNDKQKKCWISDPYKICSKERCEILGNCAAIEIKLDNATGKTGYYDTRLNTFVEYTSPSPYYCIEKDCNKQGLPKVTNINAEFYTDSSQYLINCDKSSNSLIIDGNDKTNCNFEATGVGTYASERTRWETEWNSKSLVPWATSLLKLEIETNQRAKCRWIMDKRQASFDEMNDFVDDYLYPKTHQAVIPIAGASARHEIFIKCSNLCAEKHNEAFDLNVIKFTIGDMPDWVPPFITFINPGNNMFVDAEALNNKAEVEFWVSENIAKTNAPKECRYSSLFNNYSSTWEEMIYFNDDPKQKGYNLESPIITTSAMYTNNQECSFQKNKECAHVNFDLDLSKQGVYDDINLEGLNITDLPGLTVIGQYKFIIRCMDVDGNVGDPYIYILNKIPPYEITIRMPNPLDEDERFDEYDVNPIIDVNTSRATFCKYTTYTQDCSSVPKLPNMKWDGNNFAKNSPLYNRDITFIDEQLSIEHFGKVDENRTLLSRARGVITNCFYTMCIDEYGIKRDKWIDLPIKKDEDEPFIIRFYRSYEGGDVLHIETNEQTTCRYQIDDRRGCKWKFDEHEIMVPEELSKFHAAEWSEEVVYYIKCKDRFGNGGDDNDCTATIHPYEVPFFSELGVGTE